MSLVDIYRTKVRAYGAAQCDRALADCHETLRLRSDLPHDDPYVKRLWAEIDAIRERQARLWGYYDGCREEADVNYIITAGDDSTDLGVVGRAATLYAAKRLGRKVVREALPDGCGGYRVWQGDQQVAGGTRDISTEYRWTD